MIPQVPFIYNNDDRLGYFRGVEKLEGKTEDTMAIGRLPSKGVIQLRLVDDEKTSFEYTYKHSGRNRDFVLVTGQSWGIKFEPGSGKGHCRNEWHLYTSIPKLRERVPQCFGFVEFIYQGRTIHALMVKRVAFTLDRIVADIRELEPTIEREKLLVHLFAKTVTAMTSLSQESVVYCRDWHSGNIAFSKASTVAESSDMCLVDWSGHALLPCTSGRRRMESAMYQFIKYLQVRPTHPSKEHIRTRGVDASPRSREWMQDWDDKLESIAWSLQHWWSNLNGASPSKQLNSLWALLYAFEPNECNTTSKDGSRSLASNPEHHKVHHIGMWSPEPRSV